MSFFKNPVHSGLFQLSQGPRGDIGLVGQYVVLVHCGDIGVLVFDTVSEQLEQPQVVCGVIGIMGGGRGKGIPQFCFFLLDLHRRLVAIFSYVYLFTCIFQKRLGNSLLLGKWYAGSRRRCTSRSPGSCKRATFARSLYGTKQSYSILPSPSPPAPLPSKPWTRKITLASQVSEPQRCNPWPSAIWRTDFDFSSSETIRLRHSDQCPSWRLSWSSQNTQ